MKSSVFANDDAAPEYLSAASSAALCGKCKLGELQHKRIETAFWRNGGLVVIRNIPAMVCPTCGEEYVGNETAVGLDRMHGNGFTSHATSDQMIVPVFEYSEQEGKVG
ncbi:type II toxin-antitoxin system MqsA family antitoxin [Roseovarius sp.]|uniref:type II toxin-antitoxin system MqsA family antitoxin n=1 Tax=Roseovarius sp. TaxID=1486281 RepID=UPI003A977C1D